jgi:hypothetical protein
VGNNGELSNGWGLQANAIHGVCRQTELLIPMKKFSSKPLISGYR